MNINHGKNTGPNHEPEGRGALVGAQSGPTVLRIALGAQLRKYREASGLTTAEAAEVIRATHSKISRLERGRTTARQRDVADLLTLYGVTDEAERDKLLELTRPERIELGAKRGHPPGIQTVVLVPSFSPAGHEPESGEHAEVLRDRRPAHGEVTGQLGHRLFAVPQQLQQAAAIGLRDRDNQVGHANTLVVANTISKGWPTTHMEKNCEPPP